MTIATGLRPLADAVAVIDEAGCIGCTLCIQACPVDAIVGAAKLMHTVLSDTCTGCELCVPPCPVDCIEIRPRAPRDRVSYALATEEARERHRARNARLAREHQTRLDKAAARRKRDTIARAIERARERLDARRR